MHTRTETVMSKDIRIGVKVQNNLILAKMEKAGLKTIAELSRAVGISQTELGRMANMKMLPFTKEGDWHNSSLKLAEFFECLPEDLFSEFQRENILEQNRAHVEMDFAEVQAMLAYQNAHLLEPSAQIESRELSSVLGQVLDSMNPKCGKVLRARFGFDGEEMTLNEVSKMFGLTREQVRLIEAKGLRILRQTSVSNLLRDASGMTFQKRA